MNNGKYYYGYIRKNIYLDNAASCLAFNKVKQSVDEFLLNYGSVHRGSGYNSEISTLAYELSRKNILNIIGGTENDCVIFTNNTTDSINKFCLINQDKSKKVLISDIEHSSNLLPWKKYFQVVQFETINFKIDSNIIESYLKNDEFEFVAVSAASNITGYYTNLEEIYTVCKKYGVKLFVDASQYAPHRIPSLKYADVIAYCGHKMGAPFGIGVLAGSKELLNKESSITGGGNIIYMDKNGNPIYKETPYMQEAGTPNSVAAIAINEAHNILYNTIGEKELQMHTEKLNICIRDSIDKLKEYGYNVYFAEEINDRSPILVISNTVKSNKETVKLLNSSYKEYDKHIFCREGAFCAYNILEKMHSQLKFINPVINGKLNPKYSLIRLSAGFINSEEDIYYTVDKLIDINKNNRR